MEPNSFFPFYEPHSCGSRVSCASGPKGLHLSLSSPYFQHTHFGKKHLTCTDHKNINYMTDSSGTFSGKVIASRPIEIPFVNFLLKHLLICVFLFNK